MSARNIALLVSASLIVCMTGCNQPAPGPSGGEQASASITAKKGGAELWADNCSRCHNIRPPQSFSDAQWEAIGMHMRLRADLTGQEQRQIVEFLKASR